MCSGQALQIEAKYRGFQGKRLPANPIISCIGTVMSFLQAVLVGGLQVPAEIPVSLESSLFQSRDSLQEM